MMKMGMSILLYIYDYDYMIILVEEDMASKIVVHDFMASMQKKEEWHTNKFLGIEIKHLGARASDFKTFQPFLTYSQFSWSYI